MAGLTPEPLAQKINRVMGRARPGETPGQFAGRLIREAQDVLNDPSKAEYHEQLRAAVERLQAQVDFWNELALLMEAESDQ